jgi:hypothetical protein
MYEVILEIEREECVYIYVCVVRSSVHYHTHFKSQLDLKNDIKKLLGSYSSLGVHIMQVHCYELYSNIYTYIYMYRRNIYIYIYSLQCQGVI